GSWTALGEDRWGGSRGRRPGTARPDLQTRNHTLDGGGRARAIVPWKLLPADWAWTGTGSPYLTVDATVADEVTIFSDYTCPSCRRLFLDVLPKSPDGIRRQVLDYDIDMAIGLGLDATPTIIVDGQIYRGIPRQLRRLLEKEWPLCMTSVSG